MALPKAYRLKSRQDFQAVFREGIRRHSSHFTLRALKPSWDTAPPATKIGIAISTKVSKRAVVRNKIKRQITAALYQLLPKLVPGWRLVLIVKPITAESEPQTHKFLRELEELLAQTEVLNGHS
ncbi:ribonuclease P protein component [Dolichospermum circinale CS-1225]|uniref:Ribonuclease P protein component n=1 Tax=Dolichospermum circinale CS-537/01 TaxID=3021739 RepID=A0ABT5A6Z5_9CYAN|nr:ribonuclease P protein component [Dolichospermum circinale]MDB9465408.1 ribonuclease P protein component [Dolichospermum circinale CS-539/09]MDB9471944.1 ribonuclease P protein component [Dolichospermum circinale CS-539]MDB9487720.1 ribonuclease P protein component [Dolichospermum circinale CS-537/01]MDB9524071.1 ribonuclease P protein component [Dolichospermum circinale CS-1225]